MDGLAVGFGVALLLVSLLVSTVNMTLRGAFRARLSEQLHRRGRHKLMEVLLARREELVVATATIRMLANIAVTLLVLSLVLPAEGALNFEAYLRGFVVAAVLVFLFSVGLPHVWAEYAGEGVVAALAPLLLFCGLVFRPVVVAKDGIDKALQKLGGYQPEQNGAISEIEQEIIEAVSEGQAQGQMDEDEKEMIVSVIELRDQDAAEIMTPRIEMVGIEVGSSLDEIRAVVAEQGHSRLPVYEDSLDNILGILYVRDLLVLESGAPVDLKQIMRKGLFVPETKTVRDLLTEFKQEQMQIAIVLDEYGGTAGLVTITDILEELVGNITEAYEEPEPQPVVKIDGNTAEIDARFRVDEFNERFDLNLPEDEGYDTMAGFVLSRLGRIPNVGEEFTLDNLRVTVIEADERRINRIRTRVLPEQESQAEKEAG